MGDGSKAIRSLCRALESWRAGLLEHAQEAVDEERGHHGAHERRDAGNEQAVLPVVVGLVRDGEHLSLIHI